MAPTSSITTPIHPTTPGIPGFVPNFNPAFLAQSRVPQIYAAVITVTVLATIAVALRFICRWMMKAKLRWDDWLILVSLLIEWALSAVLLYQVVDLHFGRHVELLLPSQFVPYAKTLAATQLLYYCAQTTIKLSILFLYNRIFGVNVRFRMALYVTGAVVVMWWIASFLDTVFQCIPVQASWDKSITNAKCQNIRDAALGTGVSNLILDIIILALPMPMVWALQVSKRIKISLTLIFMLGVFVVATSVIRIHQIFATDWSLTDLTWDGFGINVWSTVESCCAVIGACLPTMRPLITRARAMTSNLRSRGNATAISSEANTSKSAPLSPRPAARYQALDGWGNDSYEMKKSSSVYHTAFPAPVAAAPPQHRQELSDPHPPIIADFQRRQQVVSGLAI